jgi:hypothetical protein
MKKTLAIAVVLLSSTMALAVGTAKPVKRAPASPDCTTLLKRLETYNTSPSTFSGATQVFAQCDVEFENSKVKKEAAQTATAICDKNLSAPSAEYGRLLCKIRAYQIATIISDN